jgi:hypothetical protein
MTSLPVANISGKKFLDALFYSKSAPQSLPPQLLEASYAPEWLVQTPSYTRRTRGPLTNVKLGTILDWKYDMKTCFNK